MNFVQMRAFNALVKFGTITAAAEFLNVSKPAITTHLKNLEQTLGVRLFNRKGHSLEISQAGAAFIEPARTIGRILDEMNNIAARTSNKDEGHLRIGSCAPFTVIPILAMFTQKYPGIKTETKINNSDILADRIRQHELDVSIATLQDPPDDFFSLRLITQRILGIVSKVHPFANRRSISITELADIPCIMRESGSMTRSIIEIAKATKYRVKKCPRDW